jgi:hypothetical protein
VLYGKVNGKSKEAKVFKYTSFKMSRRDVETETHRKFYIKDKQHVMKLKQGKEERSNNFQINVWRPNLDAEC